MFPRILHGANPLTSDLKADHSWFGEAPARAGHSRTTWIEKGYRRKAQHQSCMTIWERDQACEQGLAALLASGQTP